MDVITAIRDRHCYRAFLERPVEPDLIRQILETARWAPSGVNSQPWQVAVVTGSTRQRIGDLIIAAREAGQAENPDYLYYPDTWREPYSTRRKTCGLALYQSLGIGREDKEKRVTAWYRNYRFFNAPVGLLFFMDHDLQTGSYLDMGMFLQNIMLSARKFGLETCPQASLAEYPDIVRDVLKLPSERLLVCGMALGYPDREAPVNCFRLEREPVEKFTLWYD
jgi:nitroreductase